MCRTTTSPSPSYPYGQEGSENTSVDADSVELLQAERFAVDMYINMTVAQRVVGALSVAEAEHMQVLLRALRQLQGE